MATMDRFKRKKVTMETMDGVVKKRTKLNDTAKEGEKGRQLKDDKQLLKLFKDEVWRNILARVTDFKDREHLSNSSTFFRDRLLEDRTLFLFPKVWEVIGKHNDEQEQNAKAKARKIEQNGGPIVTFKDCSDCGKWRISPLRFSWILNLRLVCKAWCNAVDSSYQNGPLNGSWAQTDFYGDANETVIPFIKHFEKTHGRASGKNPFISRTITLQLNNTGPVLPEVDDRQLEVLELLDKYGRHIWHCAIDAYDWCPEKSIYYKKLREWLELMPNLKSLNLLSTLYDAYEDESLLREMKRLIKYYPLPQLKHLNALILAQSVPTPLVAELIRSNGHVTFLDVRGTYENQNFNVYGLPLPNLENVSVDCASTREFQLLEGPKVNWPALKMLGLFFEGSCPFIKWDRVFSMLEQKFKNTLITLICELPKARQQPDKKWIVDQCQNLRLNLVNVTSLSTHVTNVTCFDFLLPMKDKLEYLHISIDPTMAGNKWTNEYSLAIEKKQQIKIVGYTDRLFESNIWSLFPKLKKVKVCGRFGKPKRQKRKSTARDVQGLADGEEGEEDFIYSKGEWLELQKKKQKLRWFR